MPTLKPDTIFPTPEEEQQIAAAIGSDPEDFEIDEAWIAKAKPAAEFFGEETLRSLRMLRHSRMMATSDTEFEGEKPCHTPHPLG